jgi:Fe-S oxidoreductase
LRVKELVKKEPEMIITSCPYCLVMLEDGIKSLQLETVKCKELTEVIRDMV